MLVASMSRISAAILVGTAAFWLFSPMPRYFGLTRERVYSPGRVDDDAAVLHSVADALRARGATVEVCDSDTVRWPNPVAGDVVFAMAQGPGAIDLMTAWERAGVRVINSPTAILNCQRHRTVPLLSAAVDVEFPETGLLDTTSTELPPWVADRVWVKRGDVHATDPGDVTLARGRAEVLEVLAAFQRRDIRRAAIQRHIDGAVVKFYGTAGGFFFPVPPEGFVIAETLLSTLRKAAHAAAKALDVEVFGGDGVCDGDGRVHIIDLNDWPSYRACRMAAAEAIAHYLDSQKAEGKE